ncbi:MAG TPA: FAD-dependent oxidoreductase [Jatrophihabitantaceae bacterium]|nr:FAD-dependent oxidoreductase [Jatrophihabitantaceae bacterium]
MTDVLILGLGCAGAAAAIEARAAGADVLVLERASAGGGSSALSGGEIYLGGGTSTQLAAGFADTADDMFAFLVAALGPHADEQKVRAYCDGSVEHHDWLTAQGVEFTPSVWDAPTWMPSTEDGLMWMGERAWPYASIANPAPRGHRPPTGHYGGWLLMDKLIAAAVAAGVRVEPDTSATALIVEDGRVAGVRARGYGEDVEYRAQRGVVITTGGFVDNETMLAAHAPRLLGHGKVSDGNDDGSGITMALEVGAAVRHMAEVQVALTIVPELAARGMVVNALGQRFVNEDVYPGLISQAAVLHQPGPYWVIVDEDAFEAVPPESRWGAQPRYIAETLDELEQLCGMPEGSLSATVEVYNTWADRGEDPYFRKAATWLRPLHAPFAALDPRMGYSAKDFESSAPSTGATGFTLGGLHTTVDGAVLDVRGRPIRGLFAAGRASAGLHGAGYISGTSLGDGTFFGRRAGRSAAVIG